MHCLNCLRDVPIENKDLGLCATCNKEARDMDPLYPLFRAAFLQRQERLGVTCPRCFKPITIQDTVHHKKGRGPGFADQWARTLGLTLTLDVRYFLGVCLPCHQFIEVHPEMAKKRGWSLSRTGITISPLSREEEQEIEIAVRAIFEHRDTIQPGSDDLPPIADI